MMECRHCGVEVKEVVSPGSNRDVRCEGCGRGGAVLPDGRRTGPVFVPWIGSGLIKEAQS